MKVFARFQLNLTGDKSFYLFNGTEKYFQKLRVAYQDIKSNKKNEYLYFAFFTLCSATLEYSLNYLLADYCVCKFGPERYKLYLEEYINMKFKSKFLLLPHIITEGNFRMNEDARSFKKICELISNRNRLLHNKEFLKEFDLLLNFDIENSEIQTPIDKDKIDFSIEIEDSIIEKINKEMCLDYAQSMSDFKKYIMDPFLENKISSNILLIKNSNDFR